MNNLTYIVIEKDDENQMAEKTFESNKEDALTYFKSRCDILSKELKDWKMEPGINSCIWSKNDNYKLIYVQVNGIENQEF